MKKLSIILSFIFLSLLSFSQSKNDYFDFSKRGEAYFSFTTDNQDIIQQLAHIISIDKVEKNGNIIAYANEKEFNRFLEFGLEPNILTPPSMLEEYKMFTLDEYNSKAVYEWDSYPTYDTYIEMMGEFENDFPELCETIEFGTTVNNRKLLICKLTSSLNPTAKAKIHFSSTMHGDENTGFVLMLRFIDYLLNNYATDSRIKNILDNAEVWICPNANPDGTYYGGNNSINGSKRYNGNYVDLNRNYKDDRYGLHPDGEDWQPETLRFMELQEAQQFHLAVNIHGGAEVCNFPWDNKYTYSADDDWWIYVCREYADTVQYYAPSYYMREEDNGIVRGAFWYLITGSRQDYANYYDHCREFCLEISETKNPSGSQLPNYWNWNYRSFLNYTEQALYGIHGNVTNAATGQAVKCEVKITGHDNTESQVYSNPSTGYYVRPIKAGTYTVTYSAFGYETETRTITITDKQKIIQDIQLQGFAPEFSASNTEVNITENNQVTFSNESYSIEPITQYSWVFEGGTPRRSNEENPTVTYNQTGSFDVSLTISNGTNTATIKKEDYISVADNNMEPPIAEFYADNSYIYPYASVEFIDDSQNNPTAWEWIFEGGTPATSNEQNPVITYEQAGNFDVTLKVTNEYGEDVITKTNFIQVALSIEEFESNIKIYPNPATDAINIQSESLIKEIDIMDLSGRKIINKTINNNNAHISTNGISPGLYFIKIQLENSNYSTKILISN